MRDWLVKARRNKAMTQLAVARHSGISRAYYTQIENGRRDPSIRVAVRLARLLELEWTEFFASRLAMTADRPVGGQPEMQPELGVVQSR